jgi:acetyl esterase/lipase
MIRNPIVAVVVASACLFSPAMHASGAMQAGQRGQAMPPARVAPQTSALTDDVVTIPLWEGGAPGALGEQDADRPTLTVYRARTAVPTGIIVAPGGGYGNLAMNHEGRQVANWFNALGVTAFVLKYRLGPRYHHPTELGDAQRAIRIARARAHEFGIVPDRLGMIGFSAGGHLVSTAATHFDAGNPSSADPIERVSSRPDFVILGYPVISFKPEITHSGSVRNLLGENPAPALLQELSNELHVTDRTPPTFLFHTNADTGVSAENSVRFYLALRAAKVPAEMHIFEKGPHGVGLALGDPMLSEWPVLLANWMRGRGLLDK